VKPSVSISGRGRSGHVVYRESAGEQTFYWEFGGRDVVATVQVGTEADWRRNAPWAADRRADILRFVAAEVLRQKAPGCAAEIADGAGCIVIRQRESPPGAPPS
jgi:hypothetical protein